MLNLRNRDGTNDDTIKDEVADVQNYDREQYRKVLELERDWVKRWTDDVKPHTQLDRTVEQRTEKESEKVINLLEIRIDNLDKLALIDVKASIVTTSQQNRTYFTELLDNAEVIRFYNDLIRSYINLEITQDTREAIKTNIQSLRPYIDTLVFGLNAYINKYIFNVPLGGGILAADKLLFNKTYLLKLLTALSVYTFMQKSLFRGTYSPITKNDIDFQLNEITSKLSPAHKVIYNNALVGNNMTKSQADAEARRIQLLTDDQNAPLSDDQVLQMQRSIFGANLASRGVLSPAELNALQPDERQIEEYRQAETEAQRERDVQTGQSIRTTEEQQRQQAEQRILAGLPPLYVEPEIPAFETTREKSVTKADFLEEKRIFDEKVEFDYSDYIQKCTPRLNNLEDLKNPKANGNPKTITAQAQYKNYANNIKTFSIDLFKKYYFYKNNVNATPAEIQQYTNDINVKYPNLALVAGFDFGGTNAEKLLRRNALYVDCNNLVVDAETLRDDTLKVYEDKKRLLGYGKPLYHRKYKNNSNLYFNDDKNDYYNF
jgi:hypothetical protein